MKLSKTFFLHGSLVLAMFVVGFWLYPKLPDVVPTHWNFEGQPDSYSSKQFAVWFFPSLTLLMTFLFPVLAKMDPHKEKYAQFQKAWFMIRTIILSCFAYLYFVSLYAALNPMVDVGSFVLCGIAVMFILMGNYLGKVRQNYFLGIRTPWTLHDEDIWNKTHRLSGWMFVLVGLLLLVEVFLKLSLPYVIFVTIALLLLVPIIYSYLLFRQKTK